MAIAPKYVNSMNFGSLANYSDSGLVRKSPQKSLYIIQVLFAPLRILDPPVEGFEPV